MKKYLLEDYIKYTKVNPLLFLKKIKDDDLNFYDITFKREEIYFLSNLFKNCNWKDLEEVRKKFIKFFSSTGLYIKYIENPVNRAEEEVNNEFYKKIDIIVSKINDRFLKDCFYENSQSDILETFLRMGSNTPARSIKRNVTYQQQDAPGMFKGNSIYDTFDKSTEVDWHIEEDTDSFTGNYMIRMYIKYILDGEEVKRNIISKSFETKEELDAWKSSSLINIIRKYDRIYNNNTKKDYISAYWK